MEMLPKSLYMKCVNKGPWSFVTFLPKVLYLNSTDFIFKLTSSLMPPMKYEVIVLA